MNRIFSKHSNISLFRRSFRNKTSSKEFPWLISKREKFDVAKEQGNDFGVLNQENHQKLSDISVQNVVNLWDTLLNKLQHIGVPNLIAECAVAWDVGMMTVPVVLILLKSRDNPSLLQEIQKLNKNILDERTMHLLYMCEKLPEISKPPAAAPFAQAVESQMSKHDCVSIVFPGNMKCNHPDIGDVFKCQTKLNYTLPAMLNKQWLYYVVGLTGLGKKQDDACQKKFEWDDTDDVDPPPEYYMSRQAYQYESGKTFHELFDKLLSILRTVKLTKNDTAQWGSDYKQQQEWFAKQYPDRFTAWEITQSIIKKDETCHEYLLDDFEHAYWFHCIMESIRNIRVDAMEMDFDTHLSEDDKSKLIGGLDYLCQHVAISRVVGAASEHNPYATYDDPPNTPLSESLQQICRSLQNDFLVIDNQIQLLKQES